MMCFRQTIVSRKENQSEIGSPRCAKYEDTLMLCECFRKANLDACFLKGMEAEQSLKIFKVDPYLATAVLSRIKT